MYVDVEIRPLPDEARMLCLCASEGCENTVQQPVWRPKKNHWSYYRFCCACTHLKHQYGITVPDRQKMLDGQDGKCAICHYDIFFSGVKHYSSDRKHAVLDHCHDSSGMREILCGNCNIMLGKAMDDPVILQSAIDYLEKHKILLTTLS